MASRHRHPLALLQHAAFRPTSTCGRGCCWPCSCCRRCCGSASSIWARCSRCWRRASSRSTISPARWSTSRPSATTCGCSARSTSRSSAAPSRWRPSSPSSAAIIAFPIAYYMARYAGGQDQGAVLRRGHAAALVELPGAGLFLAPDPGQGRRDPLGVQRARARLACSTGILALPVVQGSSLSTSHIGTCITFVYIWLPYMILPLQAALERVPRSFIEASSDLGAKPSQTFRKVILPLAIPGVAAGSIFTFSLTLGDYIIPQLIGSSRPFIGQAVYQFQGTAGDIPMAAAFADGADRDHGGLSLDRQTLRSLRCPLRRSPADRATPQAGCGLTAGAWFAVLFLNLPILFIVLYGFTTDEQSYTFPPPGLTTKWFGVTFGRADFWHALVAVGLGRLHRHDRGADPRHAGRRGDVPLQVLRQGSGDAADPAADRAARHRHRHLAARGLRPRRTSRSAIGPSSSATPPSASSWSTTTRSRGCGAPRRP